MATYRFPPESIDHLTRKTRRHHIAIFIIFIVITCLIIGAADRSALLEALIVDAIYCLIMLIVMLATRRRAWERTASLIRSFEWEFDDEKVSCRSDVRKKVLYRSDITEAGFCKSGVWLRSRSPRIRVEVPRDIENFGTLRAFLEEWLPPRVVRCNSSRYSVWGQSLLYGKFVSVALLLYAGIVSRTPLIDYCFCRRPGRAARGIRFRSPWPCCRPG
jgi:hypothetical protein